ncbi:hypothetical protein VR7878_03699 [Vibrio ruber DSM 16370]|uniref:Uncharacterized protein n=1 Tax=Vibrio ruber (strain DSM 16370 / JCM 11486 / BCRC 17186 / CECT 7878 / LMG 23124 / VR1) TaxID=1123498 RepID=A0A1R4LT75_VIBR1|nr:hypothetical protein [Vibrio ruber]SJN59802.1 hypothetical protein VR7878_03699 [Vibrio ruber DSM 16370]
MHSPKSLLLRIVPKPFESASFPRSETYILIHLIHQIGLQALIHQGCGVVDYAEVVPPLFTIPPPNYSFIVVQWLLIMVLMQDYTQQRIFIQQLKVAYSLVSSAKIDRLLRIITVPVPQAVPGGDF